MDELQTEAVSVEDCDFTLGSENINTAAADDGVDEGESEGVLQDVRRVVEKIKEDRELLLQQQSELRSAVASLSLIIKSK